MRDYEEAAKLDPENPNYAAATEVARSHAVTELIQTAAKARIRGDKTAEASSFAAGRGTGSEEYSGGGASSRDGRRCGGSLKRSPSMRRRPDSLAPAPYAANPLRERKLSSARRIGVTAIQTCFGRSALKHPSISSVTGPPVRFDMDDANFAQAIQAMNMATDSFTVPLDAHRALVAKDTRENRQQFMRQEFETVYLGGMTTDGDDRHREHGEDRCSRRSRWRAAELGNADDSRHDRQVERI